MKEGKWVLVKAHSLTYLEPHDPIWNSPQWLSWLHRKFNVLQCSAVSSAQLRSSIFFWKIFKIFVSMPYCITIRFLPSRKYLERPWSFHLPRRAGNENIEEAREGRNGDNYVVCSSGSIMRQVPWEWWLALWEWPHHLKCSVCTENTISTSLVHLQNKNSPGYIMLLIWLISLIYRRKNTREKLGSTDLKNRYQWICKTDSYSASYFIFSQLYPCLFPSSEFKQWKCLGSWQHSHSSCVTPREL